MVVVEYCKYGNLSNFLRAKREFFLPYRVSLPPDQTFKYVALCHVHTSVGPSQPYSSGSYRCIGEEDKMR